MELTRWDEDCLYLGSWPCGFWREKKIAADSAAKDALVGNISQLGQTINAEEKTTYMSALPRKRPSCKLGGKYIKS